jgi:hypothetical protein
MGALISTGSRLNVFGEPQRKSYARRRRGDVRWASRRRRPLENVARPLAFAPPMPLPAGARHKISIAATARESSAVRCMPSVVAATSCAVRARGITRVGLHCRAAPFGIVLGTAMSDGRRA